MSLLTESSPLHLWHEIIHDAEQSCALTLPEESENYLAMLLMRFMNKPEVLKKVIALDFLTALSDKPQQKALGLQMVGDTCLLFSGLYPKLAAKRYVKISYFIKLGQSAYANIARQPNQIFYRLADQFVTLMDVLQSIRPFHLLPMEAYDLWNESGSQRAYQTMKSYYGCTPVKSPIIENSHLLKLKK